MYIYALRLCRQSLKRVAVLPPITCCSAMDPVVLYLAYKVIKKKRRRRWSVHPINSVRYVEGVFHNLYRKLREDDDKFFNYFRMSQKSFDELAVKFRKAVETNNTLMQGLAFVPEEMLAMTIR